MLRKQNLELQASFLELKNEFASKLFGLQSKFTIYPDVVRSNKLTDFFTNNNTKLSVVAEKKKTEAENRKRVKRK